jgi:nucleotide-binding universal stress UspA family protein
MYNGGGNPQKTNTAQEGLKETAYSTIVVAFDDSDFSRAALAEAACRARKHGGKVIMVHAVYFDEEEFGIMPEQREKRFEKAREACSRAVKNIAGEFGITVEALVQEGEAHDVIAEVARQKSADLIAMGTYGRRGLKRLIMGSVTSGVITNAPCDVMVVKKPCSACVGHYESILVPFDGSEFSEKALEKACRLAKTDGADITVLYVIPRYEEMIGFMRTESIRSSIAKEAQAIIDKAAKLASLHNIAVKAVIEEGHTAERVVAIANLLGSDVIVMGSYGWKGVNRAIMGSTTERVIMDAVCPVLAAR